MPITSVTYTRAYIIGAFLQEKIGVEIQLGENQDPLQAILEAKKLTDTAHEAANPHLYNDSIPTPEPINLPVKQVEKAVAGDSKEDLELQEITKHIEGIEFQEDAIEYLNTTDFKLYVPLKILISSKPTKTK